MKISQLQHGETCTLTFAPEFGALAPGIDKGTEVRLVFPRTDTGVLLSAGTVSQAVTMVDDATRRRVTTLRETDPARLCWVVARRDYQSSTEVTVQVHRFRSQIEWTGPVSFGIDERVVERASKIADRHLSSQQASDWLAEHVFLPPAGTGRPVRAIATGSPDVQGRFRLLGSRVAVDIAPRGDELRVESVVSIRRGGSGFRPPEFLIEAEISFADATLTGQMRESVRAQIERVVAEADSYVALWEKYQNIERENLVRRARQLGWLSYHSFEALPSGLWRFGVSDLQTLQRFRYELSAASQEEIEADLEVPPELLEDARIISERNGRERDRIAVGTVDRIRLDTREILIRPLDEESDVIPPQKGVLFPALQGDRRRLERREHAVRRLKSADARMPQLALILEGENPYVRRIDRLPALTHAAKKVFDHEPTQEQRLAIDLAVNTPDLVVIQGPPGTGKTKVLAAIAARFAELEADRPELAGRTLLTSYQHDAVDHAASKSVVFGLPPVRFGGRRGDHSSQQQVERWSVQMRELAEGALRHLSDDRPLAEYRAFRDRSALYGSGRLAIDELRRLLDDLLGLPAGHLPTDVWERLRVLRRTPATAVSGADDLDRQLMLIAVRGLRTSPAAFLDDGPRKARQALARLGLFISDDERDVLSRASAAAPGAAFEDLTLLASLRDALLDRLNPGDVPGERRTVDPEMLDALNTAVSALHDRMRHSPAGIADAVEEYATALRNDPHGVRRLLEHYATVYAATCQQAVGFHVVAAKGGENIDLAFENVIVDEAARANPLDLFIPMSLAGRRIVLVGDHRQLPHLLDPDVEEALSGTVRDQEQHALKQSLFQRLFERLPLLSQNDGVVRVVTLRDQFRMHPALGRFVSDTFYEPFGEGFRSPRPASDFVHDIDGYLRAGRPVCAAWRNIPRQMGEERADRSKSRPAEARWIAAEVHRLLVTPRSDVSIGVITFYRAQMSELLDSFVQEGIADRDPDSGEVDILPEWRWIERDKGALEERLRIGTVDGFQGKEFDVVFLSVTRSNTLPAITEDDRRRKYGHLMLENRLCVAMSRQRRLLVAVGDRAMFESPEAQEAAPGLSRFLELCGGENGLVA